MPSTRAQIITRRTYCRPKDDGTFETWEEVIERVINHQRWLWERALTHKQYPEERLHSLTPELHYWIKLSSEQEAELNQLKQLLLDRKVAVAGRTFWLGGTEIGRTVELSQFNCATICVRTVYDVVDFFWGLLNGAGVTGIAEVGTLTGFRHKIPELEIIRTQRTPHEKGKEENVETWEPSTATWTIKVGDSAIAWAKSIGKLLANKWPAKKLVLDFSEIRGAGARLRNYGWISQGDNGLSAAYRKVFEILNAKADTLLTEIDINDILNLLGTVLSTRRAAEALLMHKDNPRWKEFATCKQGIWSNGKEHRAQSNNSLLFYNKPSREELIELFKIINQGGNGEPGIVNARSMIDRAPWAKGLNPCVTGDTLVHTSEGLQSVFRLIDVPFKAVVEGREYRSDGFWSTGVKPVYSLTTEDGSSVACTSNHKILTKEGWKELQHISLSDYVSVQSYCSNPITRWEKVEGIEYVGMREVFDCTVDEVHCFSANGIIVHNCFEILLADGNTCNLVTIDLAKFTGDNEGLLDAARLISRANYRQTVVDFRDGILQEKWHLNNEYLHLCGVSMMGVVKRPDMQPYDFKRLERHITHSAYTMAEELGKPYPKNITAIKPEGCRPYDALTTTDKGILTLEELFASKETDDVWEDFNDTVAVVQDGVTNKITKTFVNGIAPIKVIKLNYGIELKSTLNHAWYVKRDKDGREINAFVETKELVEGMQLDVAPAGLYTNTTASKLKSICKTAVSMRSSSNTITQPTELDSDLAWFFGYLWGDGSMSPAAYRVRFIDHGMDNLEKVAKVLKEKFGLDAKIHPCNNKRANTLEVGSKMLWHWLIKNGVFKYMIEGGIDFIPEVVRRSSKEHVIAFLAGLIDADANVSVSQGRKQIILASAEDLFSSHVQHVAWTSGIALGRSLNSKGGNFQTNKHIWLMSVSGHTQKEAGDMLIKHSNKCLRLANRDDAKWIWEEYHKPRKTGLIQSIEDGGEVPTFDIEVENEHWYYNGPVKSHNTISKCYDSTEGMHKPLGKYIFNNVAFSVYDESVKKLQDAGYYTFTHPYDPTAVLVRLPVSYEGVEFDVVNGVEVNLETAIQQLERYKMLMQNYCHQNVSCTISYSVDETDEIIEWLDNNWGHQHVAVSFLFRNDPTKTAKDLGYPYLPQEVVTKEVFEEYVSKLLPVNLNSDSAKDLIDEVACATGACPIR